MGGHIGEQRKDVSVSGLRMEGHLQEEVTVVDMAGDGVDVVASTDPLEDGVCVGLRTGLHGGEDTLVGAHAVLQLRVLALGGLRERLFGLGIVVAVDLAGQTALALGTLPAALTTQERVTLLRKRLGPAHPGDGKTHLGFAFTA